MKTKHCTHKECLNKGHPQPRTAFARKTNSADGLTDYCKECRNRDNRARRLKKSKDLGKIFLVI